MPNAIYSAAEDKDNAGPQTTSSHQGCIPVGGGLEIEVFYQAGQPFFRDRGRQRGELIEVHIGKGRTKQINK